ncbi:hypothetical protein [Aliamphritea spongicola]|nr:hypothetical protein [Aliamphritea spongicola]
MLKRNLPLLTLFLLSACTQVSDQSPLHTASATLPEYRQADFQSYLSDTRAWLEQQRVFVSADKQAELDANMPYELQPADGLPAQKAILLVHGLGDSPSSSAISPRRSANRDFWYVRSYCRATAAGQQT